MTMQIEDPVFGSLTFTDGEVGTWGKPEYLASLNATVPLQIEADKSGPTEKQRKVYLIFQQSQERLREDLQRALFAFYQSEREAYIEVMDDGDLDFYIRECAPIIEQSDEIWSLLTPYFWYIEKDADEENGHDTSFYWHGSWDVEHEFCAQFKEGKLLGIEGMGEMFYPYSLSSPHGK